MELQIMCALLIKHIVADYYVQANFMFKDKHKYGSWGGVSHALVHGLGTGLALTPFVSIAVVNFMIIIDAMLHYHIDYVKSNYSIRYPSSPSEQKYWVVHGTDQLMHVLTYVLIAWLIVKEIV